MLWSAIGRTRCAPSWETSATTSFSPSRWAPGTPSSNWPPSLKDYQGNLLILYGDTPLFRPASIRGLLNRHALRQAHLTLLTAISARPLPYGRIIRDAAGRIVDIIEETEASPAVREIHELNVGAYIVSAPAIFSALENLAPSPDGKYQLTDCVHELIRSGLRVESYQIYDPDEIQGINTPPGPGAGRVHPAKAPLPAAPRGRAAPGGVWHRRLAGDHRRGLHAPQRPAPVARRSPTRSPAGARKSAACSIGYDRRFLSNRAGEAAAEVFAGNNIPVTLLSEDAPTPAHHLRDGRPERRLRPGLYRQPQSARMERPQSLPRRRLAAAGRRDAADPGRDQPPRRSRRSSRLTWISPWRAASSAGSDFTNEYVDAVEALIDLDAIRRAGLKVIVDPMYGVGQLTLGTILTEARCRVTFIHERHNPLFGGRSPAPNLDALRLLATHVVEDHYDLGLATDGDADRIAIVDERGEYITINDILLLVYWYMHEVRGEKGGVVRNLATTHLLDRLAAHFGEQCIEVPVGFKHIASAMVAHKALLGGESSGGLTIRGHILGKDGIFACALIVEMLARTQREDLPAPPPRLRHHRPALQPRRQHPLHPRNARRRPPAPGPNAPPADRPLPGRQSLP